MPRLLLLFSLINLIIGTGAFVVGGILGPIAESLQVSVPAAGQAVTVYALSTAVLAPVMLVLTGGWRRKRAMQLALLLFALGNAVCALAPSLGMLLAGRMLMGLGAMFTPIAAGIAVASVEPARRGRALSVVFLGISLSYVIGIPLGAWLGFRYGWHAPLWVVTALSFVMLAIASRWVPADIDAPGASFQGLGRLLARGVVAWPLALTLLYFTAIFCVFSYIGPVLQALLPMSSERLSFTLMLFGLSGVAGTLIGGWANDHFGPRRSLLVQLTTLGTMMALVPLTEGSYAAVVTVFVVWGIAGFGMMTPQQSRLAAASPAQAPLLLSLNTSMLYFGTAFGAALGGAASTSIGFERLAWIGVPLALLGLCTLAFGRAHAPQPLQPRSSAG
ncbi:MFS transporter [Schlegelella sp. S2-27]|uniref:MFS transporter n=1 Tax=Caldimonas mangrovi TaxID=2944811 RepID=A0ABT0YNA5_9BURK|nr:MFS transporter [Caldimonas mangrovi]MCM5680214.1 MFS transporter [Caldimonas mangrovi]